ncbi:Ger(x)C family spore germination protein [Clostridium tetani]|uniref:Spore germination protein KC n=1 Tax=Clostridium tetani (strain Massachusetts / E88) TaxID=212717 RepID=Q892K1_CLOTE|nr:Ger(x)C family spore germination protein [Clostridium tetani]AAO36594.1 spore germination protein KC [Clostridium tetani E88]RXI60164.1 Ger(x)C family spore germination protein [Clostridium tetani]RXI61045.1 Ger(x)C family spore germination protein [Clostridium tetani]RXI65312.1 Ger(x)C family spore germination protein [Clostridium tetani]RXI71040.1 Ger(x)C family spore germination protein [Clostridium tetani]
MKIIKNKIIVILIIIFSTISFYGCWDYSEMEDFKHVAGIAVDRDKDKNEYIVTVEILETYPGSKQLKSHVVQSRDKIIHAAFRDAIKKIGNRLQLSHARVFIVSKDIAREGIVSAIDLINRDVEVRNDMWIAVSKEDLASEILTKSKSEQEIISYDIEAAIKNSAKVGKYIGVETFKLTDTLLTEGVSPILPMVKLAKKDGNMGFEVSETAVFKGDKIVGELTERETMMLQFFNGKDLEFIFPVDSDGNGTVSLEILGSKREIKVNLNEDKIVMNTYIDIDTAISELADSGINYINEEERNKLKNRAEEQIKSDCNLLVEKLKKQYKSDIIGFGKELKKKKPQKWKKVSNNWDEIFESLDINISVNIDIKYSGLTRKNIEVKN